MFKYSLGISLDTGKGQNYLGHYTKISYITDTASLRKEVPTQNTYVLIIYEQAGGVYSDTTETYVGIYIRHDSFSAAMDEHT